MTLTISEAARLLRAGNVVAFPTETVYGLGANALDAAAVAKVYALKGRPSTSPLIVHVASIEMARSIVAEWPDRAEELARRWWPGPLTMVLPKKAIIPDIVTAGLQTVGVRMPAHPVALALIKEAEVPLAAPSANRYMGISPTTAAHVEAAFGDQVPVLDGGPCQVGIESTVVAVNGSQLRLLRRGMISLGQVEEAHAEAGSAHAAPGMHHRHYSPKTPLRIVKHPNELPDEDGAYVWHSLPALAKRFVQLPANPEKYAAQLYATLHTLDAEGWPWIAVEAPPEGEEWAAIRDRLQRAQGKVK
ncbi:MAG: L-threonylcarbamoyladenylate synthase [Acidobacteriota bacterium]